jgi:hypothetical protein
MSLTPRFEFVKNTFQEKGITLFSADYCESRKPLEVSCRETLF